MNTRPTVLFTAMALLLLAGCASNKHQHNDHRPQYGLRQDVGIDSYPRGARVYIDGEMVGNTPLSAELRSNKTYEVVFERAGYKPYVEYVGADLDLKMDPFIKIGPLENRGAYNRLGPNPLQVELEHELVPDIAGTNLLSEMLLKTDQLDKHLNEGMIPIEEHRYVTQQLMDYYDDESYRRTGAPLRKDRQRTSIADELSRPSVPAAITTPSPVTAPPSDIPPLDLPPVTTSTPATPPPPVNIPGELPDLNFIQLDAGTAPATTQPAQTPPAAMPDLNNLNIGTPTTPISTPAQPLPGAIPPPPGFTPVPGELPQPAAPGTQPATPATPTTPAAPVGDPLLDGIF